MFESTENVDNADNTDAAEVKLTDVQLGADVAYTNANGRIKLAKVVGTQATISTDSENAYSSRVPAVEDGAAHLLVFSPTGNVYVKHNVPEGDGNGTFAKLA